MGVWPNMAKNVETRVAYRGSMANSITNPEPEGVWSRAI